MLHFPKENRNLVNHEFFVTEIMEIEEVEALTKSFLDSNNREQEQYLEDINHVIKTLKESCDQSSLRAECLRCLRNFVAGVHRNQIFVAEHVVRDGLLSKMIQDNNSESEEELVCLRISLQVLGNLINDNTEVQKMIMSDENFIKCLSSSLSSSDEKVLIYSSKTIQMILENQQNLAEEVPDVCERLSVLIPHLISHYQRGESWPASCLELLLSSGQYLKHLTPEERVDTSVVDVLPCPPHSSVLQLLVSDFTFLTDLHLLTTSSTTLSSSTLQASSILSLTSFLTKCSEDSECQVMMQSNKSLVINTTYLLRLVHQSAKSDDDLTVLNKLSDVSEQVNKSPTFGFKESLIGLLTNLVWGHHDNKTLVAELEGVALLLDCSQMDARNPFITQRVVLAIRALTDNHPGNQSLLARTKKLGAADSDLLRELGLSRDKDGNIIKQS